MDGAPGDEVPAYRRRELQLKNPTASSVRTKL
jgi:hypothetical protein